MPSAARKASGDDVVEHGAVSRDEGVALEEPAAAGEAQATTARATSGVSGRKATTRSMRLKSSGEEIADGLEVLGAGR